MLNHNVVRNGTYFRAYHLGRQMVRRGHQVTLLTISPRQRFRFQAEIHDGVQVVETPDWLWGRGRTGWDLWDTLRRIFYLRDGSWDLIHAFDSRPVVIFPALMLRRRGIPLILDWADWWGRGGTIDERPTGAVVKRLIGPLETYLEERFRTFARGTTVISSALRDRAISLGVKRQTIVRIPGGSDIENISPLSKSQCRESLNLPEGASIVGYVGVLNKNDAQLLFDTFARLCVLRPGCRLLVIGKHNTVLPEMPGLFETGPLPQKSLVQYLGACDLLILPLKDTVSSRGRWPSKINDYLAAGRPIIASDVGDIADLFAHHAIGYATKDDPEALAAACDSLLSDELLQKEMGRNARQLAEKEMSWSILGGELEAHYYSVLNQET